MSIRVWQHAGLCLWSPEAADRSSGAGSHREAWAIRQGCSKLNPSLNKGTPCHNHWAFSPALICQFLTVSLLPGFYITYINSLSIVHVNPLSVIGLQSSLLPWSLFPTSTACCAGQMFSGPTHLAAEDREQSLWTFAFMKLRVLGGRDWTEALPRASHSFL